MIGTRHKQVTVKFTLNFLLKKLKSQLKILLTEQLEDLISASTSGVSLSFEVGGGHL